MKSLDSTTSSLNETRIEEAAKEASRHSRRSERNNVVKDDEANSRKVNKRNTKHSYSAPVGKECRQANPTASTNLISSWMILSSITIASMRPRSVPISIQSPAPKLPNYSTTESYQQRIPLHHIVQSELDIDDLFSKQEIAIIHEGQHQSATKQNENGRRKR